MSPAQALLNELRTEAAEHRQTSETLYDAPAGKFDRGAYMLHKGYADAFGLAADRLEAALPAILLIPDPEPCCEKAPGHDGRCWRDVS